MSAIKNVLELANIAVQGKNIIQDWSHHDNITERVALEHNEELNHLREHHAKELNMLKRTHLLSTFTDMERHFQQLSADILATNKESERDMYDQRNQQCQTLILAATVMLTALVSVLIQGNLPMHASEAIYIIYSIANSGSLVFLFLSIIVYLIIVYKSSGFMIKRSVEHETLIKAATIDLERVMIGYKNLNSHKQTPKHEKSRSDRISKQQDVLREFLNQRNDIIDKNTQLLINNSFDKSWHNDCEQLASIGLVFFYTGTALCLVSTATFMWTIFSMNYSSNVGAIVSVIPIGLALIIGFLISIFLKWQGIASDAALSAASSSNTSDVCITIQKSMSSSNSLFTDDA